MLQLFGLLYALPRNWSFLFLRCAPSLREAERSEINAWQN